MQIRKNKEIITLIFILHVTIVENVCVVSNSLELSIPKFFDFIHV